MSNNRDDRKNNKHDQSGTTNRNQRPAGGNRDYDLDKKGNNKEPIAPSSNRDNPQH